MNRPLRLGDRRQRQENICHFEQGPGSKFGNGHDGIGAFERGQGPGRVFDIEFRFNAPQKVDAQRFGEHCCRVSTTLSCQLNPAGAMRHGACPPGPD